MSNQKKAGSLVVVLGIPLAILSWAAGTWMLMILVGVAHDAWWHQLPPMGLGAAAALTAIFYAWGAACAFLSAFYKEMIK